VSSLTWLKLARKVPGLNRQPEFPHLESLIEQEGQHASEELLVARWLVPLILTVVGLSVFIPLMILVHPMFLLGTLGLPSLGIVLGFVFHSMVKSLPPARIELRKQCRKLGERLLGFKNLIGIEPALSPRVGEVLDEAAMLYLRIRSRADSVARSNLGIDSLSKAADAMEDAMAKLLQLAEPDGIAAQDAALSGSWGEQIVSEMRRLDKALESSERNAQASRMIESDALARLRETREEIENTESAVLELRRSIDD
jgi:hypothetical protein